MHLIRHTQEHLYVTSNFCYVYSDAQFRSDIQLPHSWRLSCLSLQATRATHLWAATSRRQLHKNVESNIEQVLTTTPHETPTIRPLASHHENYTSEDTGCNPEDLPEAMNDREKWRERVRDIRAGGTT